MRLVRVRARVMCRVRTILRERDSLVRLLRVRVRVRVRVRAKVRVRVEVSV